MGVAVDETGGDHVAFGVDILGPSLPDAPDGGDAAVAHAYIGPIAGHTGPVDHRAVADHHVVAHAFPLRSRKNPDRAQR